MQIIRSVGFRHLNAKLNPICDLLALLGAHHILHVSRVRVKSTQCTAVYLQLGILSRVLIVQQEMTIMNRTVNCVTL